MLFDTVPAHINQIKGAIKAYGPVYFHGCGNIYAVKDLPKNFIGNPSDNRQKYSNKKASSYRVKFDSISEVPSTVEELNKKLIDSFNQEEIQKHKPTSVLNVSTFEAYADEEEATAGGNEKAKKGSKKSAAIEDEVNTEETK